MSSRQRRVHAVWRCRRCATRHPDDALSVHIRLCCKFARYPHRSLLREIKITLNMAGDGETGCNDFHASRKNVSDTPNLVVQHVRPAMSVFEAPALSEEHSVLAFGVPTTGAFRCGGHRGQVPQSVMYKFLFLRNPPRMKERGGSADLKRSKTK